MPGNCGVNFVLILDITVNSMQKCSTYHDMKYDDNYFNNLTEIEKLRSGYVYPSIEVTE